MVTLDPGKVNRYILTKHHLTEASKTNDIISIARDITGLHGTDAITPYISLFSRMKRFKKEDLRQEMIIRRSLVRIRCMRRTLHLLPIDMIPTAFAATRDLFKKRPGQLLEHLGISKRQFKKVSSSILDLLSDGKGRTITEIKADTKPSSHVSPIISILCDEGRILRGHPPKGWRGSNYVYHLISEFLPGLDLDAFQQTEATDMLIRSHIGSYGPVTKKDITWWTGLRTGMVNGALTRLEKDISHCDVDGLSGDHIILTSQLKDLKKARTSRKAVVNLLPASDPYMMGFKERDRYLGSCDYHMVFDRSGNATSVILVDGEVAGIWDQTHEGPTVKVHYL